MCPGTLVCVLLRLTSPVVWFPRAPGILSWILPHHKLHSWDILGEGQPTPAPHLGSVPPPRIPLAQAELRAAWAGFTPTSHPESPSVFVSLSLISKDLGGCCLGRPQPGGFQQATQQVKGHPQEGCNVLVLPRLPSGLMGCGHARVLTYAAHAGQSPDAAPSSQSLAPLLPLPGA